MIRAVVAVGAPSAAALTATSAAVAAGESVAFIAGAAVAAWLLVFSAVAVDTAHRMRAET